MYKKALGALFVLGLLAVATPASATSPSTWYVDSAATTTGDGSVMLPFETIGEAITAASSGDTVELAAGTYDEQLSITESLTIMGTGPDTIVAWTSAGYGVSINNTSDVTLQDMYIDRAGYGGGIEVVGAVANNLEFSGITVTGATNAPSHLASPYVGLRVGTGTDIDDLTVSDSHFDGNDIGWYLAKESANSTSVSNIDVSSTSFDDNLMKGIYAEKMDNAMFDDISVMNSGIEPTYGFNAGIDINLKWSDYENITIKDSVVTGSGLMGSASNPLFPAGITIKARDDASSYNSTPASLTGVLVENTEVSGGVVGIRFGEAGKVNLGPLDAVVVDSSLVGTGGFGLVNETAASITATNNWWGSAASPNAVAIGGSGAATVSFSPWYIDEDRTTLGDGSETTQTSGGDTLDGESNDIEVEVEIPSDTVITGDASWDGIITPPTATEATITIQGFDIGITAAVIIGSSQSDLTFSKAVRLQFSGQAGKLVGWFNHDGDFSEITTVCVDDTQDTNNTLGAGGDCRIDVDGDLVVWTKHFSIFATYTQESNNSGGGGSVKRDIPVVNADAGEVLGAETGPATTTPGTCVAPLLTDGMRIDWKNNPEHVKVLQAFLNAQVGSTLPITGTFGPATLAAVKAFQTKYAAEILAPWGMTEASGWVYKFTLWKINSIACSNLPAPKPTAVIEL